LNGGEGVVTLSNEERENPASGKRNDVQVRRFMTVPGIGPITALCYLAIIDDPTRFKRSRSVGAYVGLTSRRYASGEVDWTGRISKCGDAMLRSDLPAI
jgi:transposase